MAPGIVKRKRESIHSKEKSSSSSSEKKNKNTLSSGGSCGGGGGDIAQPVGKKARDSCKSGACQCPKPGDLPVVDGEGESSASVSWANGVSLGPQVSSERRETAVDLVLLGHLIDAIRQLRPSMTAREYDKAKIAWNKEVMLGNLVNVNDFVTERNLRAKRRMTKATMKRHFIK